METILIVFLLAVLALVVIYVYYDRFRREKKSNYPTAYIEGLRMMLESRDEAAFSRFRDVIAEDSTNIDAYIRIGNILRKYNKADKALQVHKDLTLRHDVSPEEKFIVLEAIARDYEALEDYHSARAALQEAYDFNPENTAIAEKLERTCTRLADWEGAFKIREKLARHDGAGARSKMAAYKFFQGQQLYDRKKYHDARIIFKDAIHTDADCVPAYIWIGDSYVAENRLEDAVAIWKKLIQTVPQEAHLVLGRLKKALFDLGRFGVISDICRDILSVSKDNLEARLTLAEYHLKKGEYNLAIEHLSVAADNNPNSYLPSLELARLYLITDDKEKLAGLLDNFQSRRDAVEGEYHCLECGHKSQSKIWHCPSCQAVNSFVK